MRTKLSIWISVVIGCGAGLAGCGERRTEGPPELRLGQDECGACGMVVGEERCSAAWLIEEAGRREYLVFDDLGCRLDAERRLEPSRRVIGSWVHDYQSQAWVNAGSAVYLAADAKRLMTPMGSGMVAFATRAEAEEGMRQWGGQIVNEEGLRALHAARREELYGPGK